MTLSPSCISLRAHYSGRCPIVPTLRAFSWAYQKHNTKICRGGGGREGESGGGGGPSQSQEDSEKVWHQKQRREDPLLRDRTPTWAVWMFGGMWWWWPLERKKGRVSDVRIIKWAAGVHVAGVSQFKASCVFLLSLIHQPSPKSSFKS